MQNNTNKKKGGTPQAKPKPAPGAQKGKKKAADTNTSGKKRATPAAEPTPANLSLAQKIECIRAVTTWSADEDILRVLSESDNNVEVAIEKIVSGDAGHPGENWTVVSKKHKEPKPAEDKKNTSTQKQQSDRTPQRKGERGTSATHKDRSGGRGIENGRPGERRDSRSDQRREGGRGVGQKSSTKAPAGRGAPQRGAVGHPRPSGQDGNHYPAHIPASALSATVIPGQTFADRLKTQPGGGAQPASTSSYATVSASTGPYGHMGVGVGVGGGMGGEMGGGAISMPVTTSIESEIIQVTEGVECWNLPGVSTDVPLVPSLLPPQPQPSPQQPQPEPQSLSPAQEPISPPPQPQPLPPSHTPSGPTQTGAAAAPQDHLAPSSPQPQQPAKPSPTSTPAPAPISAPGPAPASAPVATATTPTSPSPAPAPHTQPSGQPSSPTLPQASTQTQVAASSQQAAAVSAPSSAPSPAVQAPTAQQPPISSPQISSPSTHSRTSYTPKPSRSGRGDVYGGSRAWVPKKEPAIQSPATSAVHTHPVEQEASHLIGQGRQTSPSVGLQPADEHILGVAGMGVDLGGMEQQHNGLILPSEMYLSDIREDTIPFQFGNWNQKDEAQAPQLRQDTIRSGAGSGRTPTPKEKEQPPAPQPQQPAQAQPQQQPQQQPTQQPQQQLEVQAPPQQQPQHPRKRPSDKKQAPAQAGHLPRSTLADESLHMMGAGMGTPYPYAPFPFMPQVMPAYLDIPDPASAVQSQHPQMFYDSQFGSTTYRTTSGVGAEGKYSSGSSYRESKYGQVAGASVPGHPSAAGQESSPRTASSQTPQSPASPPPIHQSQQPPHPYPMGASQPYAIYPYPYQFTYPATGSQFAFATPPQRMPFHYKYNSSGYPVSPPGSSTMGSTVPGAYTEEDYAKYAMSHGQGALQSFFFPAEPQPQPQQAQTQSLSKHGTGHGHSSAGSSASGATSSSSSKGQTQASQGQAYSSSGSTASELAGVSMSSGAAAAYKGMGMEYAGMGMGMGMGMGADMRSPSIGHSSYYSPQYGHASQPSGHGHAHGHGHGHGAYAQQQYSYIPPQGHSSHSQHLMQGQQVQGSTAQVQGSQFS